MVESEPVERPTSIPLTLASRQALAKSIGLDTDATSVLEREPCLEQALAALLDQGHADPALRLVARMLTPSEAALWVVLSHDQFLAQNPETDNRVMEAREGLLEFARNPDPNTQAKAETACQALGGTHPLAMVALSLCLASPRGNPQEAGAVGMPPTVFPDLVGRAVLLIALSFPGDKREKEIQIKRSAGCGVSLALKSATT
jgi:hypothetical protein